MEVQQEGQLTKVSLIHPPTSETTPFLKQASDENWLIEEVINEWNSSPEYKDIGIILMDITLYKNQFNIGDYSEYIYKYQNEDIEYHLVYVYQDKIIEVKDLKNVVELSGIGKILTEFDTSFEDLNTKFLKDSDGDFFNIDSSQIIINDIHLKLINKDTPGDILTDIDIRRQKMMNIQKQNRLRSGGIL